MERNTQISVVVTGLRGIPNVQGGIETHARMLYPLLAKLGCAIQVMQRSPYFPRETRKFRYHGVDLVYIWVPKIIIVETALHSLLAILYAAFKRPHIVHIHGIGPAFLVPVAKLFRLKVVVTHHTFDYRREKWNRITQRIFQAGEALGIKFADAVIVVSPDIKRHVLSTYGVTASVIPNGARMPVKASSTKALEAFGIVPRQYVICVSRLESTKRHGDLIDAFERAETNGWKLVIVGGLEPADNYIREIIKRAETNKNIVLTGFQTGLALRELYSNAALFVLSSSHEGQPIALLEALSFGIPSVASDIPANRSTPLPNDRFFNVGDIDRLKDLLELYTNGAGDSVQWSQVRQKIRAEFDWKIIARQTRQVFDTVIDKSR